MANKPPRSIEPKTGTRLARGVVPTDENRAPPQDIEAEAAVISAVLVDPAAHAKVRFLKPEFFYSEAHRRIYEVAEALAGEGSPVDVITVATRLRDTERLAQAGGVAYLTDILNKAPAVANVAAYAEIVRTCAHERVLLVSAQRTVAELYARKLTGRSAVSILADLKLQIESTERELSPSRGGIQFLEDDALYAPDPPADLVVPTLGLGAGPPIGFFGQGYAGKSVVAFALGMAIAGGHPIWGNYRAKEGTWVHLDHEQGKRRTKALVQRMTLGMSIQRETVRGRLRHAIYPEVNLTSPNALTHYCRAFEGATVATCDALKGMTPGVDENDSAIREYIDMLGKASEKTGCMVILIHHAGKTPMDGSRPRKEAGRGSSGIFDACASVFVMSAKKGEPTMVTHEKDRELGYTVEDFGLRIEDVETGDIDQPNPRGGLRVVHLDREQMKPKGETAEDAKAEWLKAVSKIRDCIRDNPGVAGADAVTELVKMRRKSVGTAIQTLIADGDVVEAELVPGRGKARRLYVKGAAPKSN